MVSNKVLVGRRGGVIRGSGFSKYRETRTHASHREREREHRGAVTIRFEAKVSPPSRATSISVRTYVRTYVRLVYVRARAYIRVRVQDWPVYSMPREKILRDVAITDEPTHTVRQRQTGQHRDRTGTVSLGIRTVNPGFYSPGIEVYSVLSARCVRAPFVWLSYVQPSRGKTFAYLRSFALLYGGDRLRKRRAERTNARGEGGEEEEAGKDVPSSSPPFTSPVRHPPRNETFLKNARFYLGPPPPLLFFLSLYTTRGINRLSGESNLSDGLAFIERPHLTSRLIRHRPTGVLNDGAALMTLLLPSDPL